MPGSQTPLPLGKLRRELLQTDVGKPGIEMPGYCHRVAPRRPNVTCPVTRQGASQFVDTLGRESGPVHAVQLHVHRPEAGHNLHGPGQCGGHRRPQQLDPVQFPDGGLNRRAKIFEIIFSPLSFYCGDGLLGLLAVVLKKSQTPPATGSQFGARQKCPALVRMIGVKNGLVRGVRRMRPPWMQI